MKSYVHGDSLTLQEFRDGSTGLRPSHQKLLSLIDTSCPAWPAVVAALREMADAGIEIDGAAVRIAEKLGGYRFAMLARAKPPGRDDWKPPTLSGSIVYYIRRGPVIKIGTTTEASVRLGDLMPDEILAFEPGGLNEETLRHHQFAHLRCRGEHFRPEPELLEHIRRVRELHGDPDPDWPTVASLARSPDIREDVPPLKSGETITAEQASERGVSERRLRNWAYGGRITPAGYSDDGQELYYAEHLAALCRRPWRH
jgi:hypothetical protein